MVPTTAILFIGKLSQQKKAAVSVGVLNIMTGMGMPVSVTMA